jgi:hypothetical protein
LDIVKESFCTITLEQINTHLPVLQTIFDRITFKKYNSLFYNELYDNFIIRSKIRIAFSLKKDIESETEIIPKNAKLLLIEKLTPITYTNNLYPSEISVNQIVRLDESGRTIPQLESDIVAENNRRLASFVPPSPDQLFAPSTPDLVNDLSSEVKMKDQTFHYLPYNFTQSTFEKNILTGTFSLNVFQSKHLEIYYNGERYLTSFNILCFENKNKVWRYLGKYTPDFLIIERKNNKIYRVLIIEAKGKIYAQDEIFDSISSILKNSLHLAILLQY